MSIEKRFYIYSSIDLQNASETMTAQESLQLKSNPFCASNVYVQAVSFFQNVHCKFIQLQYTSNTNHVRASNMQY